MEDYPITLLEFEKRMLTVKVLGAGCENCMKVESIARQVVMTMNPTLSIPWACYGKDNNDAYNNKIRTLRWPAAPEGGIFTLRVSVHTGFIPKDAKNKEDTAYFTFRGNTRGGDFKGPDITQTGWWTLGMSCTPDGQVHYYVRPGIEGLTVENYVTSQFPYSYRAERFRTFFFNVCNRDDGVTWSTPWVIDDPTLYVGSGAPPLTVE